MSFFPESLFHLSQFPETKEVTEDTRIAYLIKRISGYEEATTDGDIGKQMGQDEISELLGDDEITDSVKGMEEKDEE